MWSKLLNEDIVDIETIKLKKKKLKNSAYKPWPLCE